MISQEIQDKLSQVQSALTTKYTQRDNIRANLASVDAVIKKLEDTRDRLVQADVALKGIVE